MSHEHHLFFVGLSVLIAVCGAWTALDLFRRVRFHIGQARRAWLLAAAVAMGASIWSMHFVAMLGFDPGSPVSYDPALTLLSLIVAIGATSGAFLAASQAGASRGRLIVAGVTMGAGICLMHYIGMAALRTATSIGYRPSYILASLVIAIVASTAALVVARLDNAPRWRALASAILGMAVVGMHYTAMAGLQLVRVTSASAPAGAPPFLLGVAVAAVTLVVLVLALLASVYDQRLNVIASLEGGDVGYWELTLKDMTLQVSARGREILGRAPDEPFGYADLLASLPPADLPRRQEALDRALASGGIYDIEYRLEPTPGQARWVNTRGRVVSWAHGKPQRMAGVILDVTERRDTFERLVNAEKRQRLLIDELNHRVKNTLATVQSIARQSAKGAASVPAFRDAFEARLMSLSKTHNVLTRGSWEQASLKDILLEEFAPHSLEQVRLHGEEVWLTPRQALAVGMIAHELATNAAKYGALSTSSGCVEIAWRVNPLTQRIEAEWTETGGPGLQPPSKKGFGSTLIERLATAELGGEASLRFLNQGVSCELSFPVEAENLRVA